MRALVLGAAFGLAGLVASSQAGQNSGTPYTVITAEARRPLPVRSAGGRELAPLDRVAALFGFTVTEDASVGGLTLRVGGQRILLLPDQAFAQVAGRVVPLSGPIQRDRTTWEVPLDFLTVALGPALGATIDIRRDGRLIVVGDIRVPRVTGRVEARSSGTRLVFDVTPAAPHRVTREGRTLLIRFDAAFVDFRAFAGFPRDFVTGVRLEGTAIRIALGAVADRFEASPDADSARVVVDVLPAPPPPPPPPPPPMPTALLPGRGQGAPPDMRPPDAPLQPRPGWLRTLVIDPGHGGDDAGARGPGGATEKDVVLEIARRLKAAIDTRWGLRVLLTRDQDQAMSIDDRTALANTNKADLLISLHANASVRPTIRGAQVLALAPEVYQDRVPPPATRMPPVPVVGGGFRAIDPVPWEVAQLPFAERSAAFGGLLARHLAERGVTPYATPVAQAPLRVLVGAHMPAVLIEMGFLTNADDERELTGTDLPAAIIEAILAAIADVRISLPLPATLEPLVR